MENASKALIMAGGALILILLFSFMVIIFNRLSAYSDTIYNRMELTDIAEFNNQFIKYDGKQNLKIQDVVSLGNLAKHNNDSQKIPVTVTVLVDGEDIQEKIKDSNKYITENIGKEYSCKISYSGEFVNKVEISTTK